MNIAPGPGGRGPGPGQGDPIQVADGDHAPEADADPLDVAAGVDADAAHGDTAEVLLGDGEQAAEGRCRRDAARYGPTRPRAAPWITASGFRRAFHRVRFEAGDAPHLLVDEVDAHAGDAAGVAQAEADAVHRQVEGAGLRGKGGRPAGAGAGAGTGAGTLLARSSVSSLYSWSCTISSRVSLLSRRASSR